MWWKHGDITDSKQAQLYWQAAVRGDEAMQNIQIWVESEQPQFKAEDMKFSLPIT